jgi:AcrR family transcriptional regulator
VQDQVEEGLRARKKRETRTRIAKTAMRLFTERGFDAVSVAEIARAADVSEKTVFNYFPTKEDLVADRGERRLVLLEQAIRDRPAGASLVEPFRSLTLFMLDTVEFEPVETTTAIPRLVMESRSLRDRLFVGWEQEAERVTALLAEETGADPDDLVPHAMARALTWAHRTIFRAAFQRLLDGEDQAVVARELRREAKRVYQQLEMGLATYGRRPG